MRKLFSVFLVITSITLGAIFLYSAYTKSYTFQSFEGFEFSIAEYTHLPWTFAAFLSRFFIGLETAIGVFLILHLYGKNKWLLKLAIGLLLLFSIYLAYVWATAGNKDNCGCFGDAVFITPSLSILKNIVLLIFLFLLLRFHSQLPLRLGNLIIIILLPAIISIPFYYFPLPTHQPSWLKKDHYHIDLSVLYTSGKTDTSALQLDNGKYIIAFLSPSCPHCQIAAYKMHLMKERNPTLPFFMVIGGQKDLGEFWQKTKAQNIPYCRLNEEVFFKIAGYKWPVIDWLNNGWVEAQSNYASLDQHEIEIWLKASK